MTTKKPQQPKSKAAKPKAAEETIVLHDQSPHDLQEGDLAIWPVVATDGTIVDVEETNDRPMTHRAERGQSRYDQIFNRIEIDGGGLKITHRNAARAMASAMKGWIKGNKQQGRVCLQKWPDGYRLFWVSKK